MATQSNPPLATELVRVDSAEIDLAVHRAPAEVIQEAQRAASVLKDVIEKKPHKIRFNNRQYLEFEDWQTVGRFYGVTARIRESKYVEYGDAKGFEAIADAVMVATGQVVSSAEAMCLNDEKNWKSRTLNQIRSMAQTRACAKALRNVLSWVVVLAGYAPTPAEEMDRDREGEEEEQQRVKNEKIDKLSNGDANAEIKSLLDGIAQGKVDACFDYIQNEAIKAGGAEAEKAYLARLAQLGERVGSENRSPTVAELRDVATFEWSEVRRLRKEKERKAI